MLKRSLLVATLGIMPMSACAQEQLESMTIEEYTPISTLVVVAENPVAMAKYPFIDVHSHHFQGDTYTDEQIADVIADMESLNMAVAVNLSGGSGEKLAAMVQSMQGRYPSRSSFLPTSISMELENQAGQTERLLNSRPMWQTGHKV